MRSVADAVHDKVTAFVRNSDQFRRVCIELFERVDYSSCGRVTVTAAAGCVEVLFEELQRACRDYGIVLDPLTPDDVRQIFEACDIDSNARLDEREFTEFYARVVTYAAMRSAAGFGRKYGMAAIWGLMGTLVAKRVMRRLPVVGLVTAPFLALMPAMIVGPLLGMAVVYGAAKGDLMAFRKKLFPSQPDKKDS